MLRRSRINVRPNVRPAGRGGTPALSQETLHPTQAPPVGTHVSVDPGLTDGLVKSNSTASGAVRHRETLLETVTVDGTDPLGEMSCSSRQSSGGPQRRKRFSVMLNLNTPRLAPALTRFSISSPQSPTKSVSETPVPDIHSLCPSFHVGDVVPHGLQSPRQRRPSGGSVQPKTSLVTPPSLTTKNTAKEVCCSFVPQSVDQDCLQGSVVDMLKPSLDLVCPYGSQAKELSLILPEKVCFSFTDKDATEKTEKAKTLMSKSTKSRLSLPPGKSRLSRLLNDAEDLHRLAKARKLRELLRQEKHKEKKIKRANVGVNEFTMDHSKMTMRDLIYYLPINNPMTSYLEEMKENENMDETHLSPMREESLEVPKEPEVASEPMGPRLDEEECEDEIALDEPPDDNLMVPRVKVAEDGSLILDEESLTVEVLRAKGPNLVEGCDPIFERGSTTTYSSFRKSKHTKPWSNQETDMFFLAISMVGTDFSMICQLFPHRVRTEIKNKFKKEERANAWRIDKAFKERRKLDLEFFTKLLQNILEVQNARNKKSKLLSERNAANRKRKRKETKSQNRMSDVEEDAEEDDEDTDIEEVEGEKENEDSNDGGTFSGSPENKQKICGKGEANRKTNKRRSVVDQDAVPERSESTLPEEHCIANRSEMVEAYTTPTKLSVIKPAQLFRDIEVCPLLTLDRQCGQKALKLSTNLKDSASPARVQSPTDGPSQEQVEVKELPVDPPKQNTRTEGSISSEKAVSISLQKSTRYVRRPRPIIQLNYPAKEDDSDSSRAIPLSIKSKKTRVKPLSRLDVLSAKIKAERKRASLVTLRASQSEDSGEEEEPTENLDEGEGSTPVFVPFGLRSPQPVFTEVEETMEEFNISVNVPDVLGISQDTLCPDASCEQVQGQAGPVPCEHQLDLLVDVIDFLSPNHTEVSQESYNEAAETLLAIGKLANPSQPKQDYYLTQDYVAETPTITAEGAVSLDDETTVASKSPVHLQRCVNPAETTEQVATKDHVQLIYPKDYPIVELGLSVTEDQANSHGETVNIAPNFPTRPEPTALKPTRKSLISKLKPRPSLSQGTRNTSSILQSSEDTETLPKMTNVKGNTPDPVVATTNSVVTEALPAIDESLRNLNSLNPSIDKASLSVTHSEETLSSQVEEEESGTMSAFTAKKSRFSKVQSIQSLGHTRGVKFKPNISQVMDNQLHSVDGPPLTWRHLPAIESELQSGLQPTISTKQCVPCAKPSQAAVVMKSRPESSSAAFISYSSTPGKSGSLIPPPPKSKAHVSRVQTKPNLVAGARKTKDEHTEPQTADQHCDQQQAFQTKEHESLTPSEDALIRWPNPGKSIESDLTSTRNYVTTESSWLVEDSFTIDLEEEDPTTSLKEDTDVEPSLQVKSDFTQKALLIRMGCLPKVKPNPSHSQASGAIKMIPSVLEPLFIEDSLRCSIPQPVLPVIYSKPQLTEQALEPTLIENEENNTSEINFNEEDLNEQSHSQKSFHCAKPFEMGLSNVDPQVTTAPSVRRARRSKAKPNLICAAKAKPILNLQNNALPELVINESVLRDSTPLLYSRPSLDVQIPLDGAEATDVCLNLHGVFENAYLSPDSRTQTSMETSHFDQAVVEGQSHSVPSTQSNVLVDQAPIDPEEPFFILSLTPVPLNQSESCPNLQSTEVLLHLSSNVASFHENDDSANCTMRENASDEDEIHPPHKTRLRPQRGERSTVVKGKHCVTTRMLPGPIVCAGELHSNTAQTGPVPDPSPAFSTIELPTGTEEATGSVARYTSKHESAPVATSNPLSRRPKGFLSFISDKTSNLSTGISRQSKRPVLQGPLLSTSTLGPKKRVPLPQEALKFTESSAAVQETMATLNSRPLPRPEMCTSPKTTAVKMPPGHKRDSTNKEKIPEDLAATQLAGLAVTKSSLAGEEPTDVSQFFFSDIFTDVDEI